MKNLSLLRAELARQNLDGFIVPHGDEFQNEYLPACNERLKWLTGFTGSAGLAIVLKEKAALFVDGRYTVQAAAETPADAFEHAHISENPPEAWLKKNAAGLRLGYDPWLHSPREIEKLARAATLVAVAANPIDAVWSDRPSPPHAKIEAHPFAYVGEESMAKRARLGAAMRDDKVDAAVLTDPASIAWLLNVRGQDVPCAPLALSYAILYADGSLDWFVDPGKEPPRLESVTQLRIEEFAAALAQLGGKTVQVDPAAPEAVLAALQKAGARIEKKPDPTILPKACKNQVELDGARAAHVRDGAALTGFLSWLAGENTAKLDELGVVARLEEFRARSNLYRGPSFETIAGSGPNGAIVHYRASDKTNRKLDSNTFLLLDSGGQYLDGTTDVTRTIALGTVSARQKEMFTRVLKGHIALATARFPKGTTGQQLDALARRALWDVGVNYDHGTGHGVGSYLSVHEGPQRISPKGEGVVLAPGMIVSNEPGYYEPGAYGIRIENLIVVKEAADGFLEFETLTLAPIDRAVLDPALLDEREREWLNAYHARVRDTLVPLLDSESAAWLREATKPL